MRGTFLLGFLFALLPLAAIGHDGYVAYQHPEMGDPLTAFKLTGFSDLGWLWTHYSPDTFKTARDTLNPGTWKLLDPILEQKTVLIAAVPLILLIVIRLMADMVQKGRMMSVGGGKQGYAGSQAKGKQVKYKRK
jgi:hypothetical protein